MKPLWLPRQIFAARKADSGKQWFPTQTESVHVKPQRKRALYHLKATEKGKESHVFQVPIGSEYTTAV